MHVLFVEPDILLGRTYQRLFEQAGHTARHARSAQAAVHAADERMPDVVVLELQLGRHNGVEFLYEFRSYSEWLDIPIIIHSFVPPQELHGAATLQTELGVCRVLHKPATSLAQLLAAVTQATAVVAT
jgi:DNA-binding response OmpR family regulator